MHEWEDLPIETAVTRHAKERWRCNKSAGPRWRSCWRKFPPRRKARRNNFAMIDWLCSRKLENSQPGLRHNSNSFFCFYFCPDFRWTCNQLGITKQYINQTRGAFPLKSSCPMELYNAENWHMDLHVDVRAAASSRTVSIIHSPSR